MKPFAFEKWLATFHLKETTKTVLENQDLDTFPDLLRLQDVDIDHLGLTIGQRNALKVAVKSLKRSEKKASWRSCCNDRFCETDQMQSPAIMVRRNEQQRADMYPNDGYPCISSYYSKQRPVIAFVVLVL